MSEKYASLLRRYAYFFARTPCTMRVRIRLPMSVQGGPPKLSQFGFLQFSINTEATWMCNMSYERKFCRLLGDIFKNCEKLSYVAEFAFFWQVAELACADLKSNFNI